MAYDIGPRIGIDGEREYREQIKNINQQMKTLDSQLKLTASEFTKETTEQQKAEATTKTLTKQIELQEEKLRQQTEMLEASKERTGEASTETQKYQEIVNKTKTELNQMKAQLQDTSTQTKTMGDKMKEAGEKIQNAGAKMKGIGDNMTKYVSAPLGALAGVSVKAFNELDDAMDITIQKTGATGAEAEALKRTFKDVAGSIEGANVSFEDSAKAVGEISTRLGFTGKELDTASKDFLKFAQVNRTDVETSVALVTRAMGDAGIEASEYGTMLDALTVATQKSGISIDKLTDNVTKYGAPMRALGYTTEESIAIFSSWEKAGVNTEIAFSGMKKAISQFTKQGKDSKKEFKKLIDGVKSGSISAQDALEIFGAKAGPDLIDAIQGGRFEFEEMLDAISGSKGALDNTFDGIIDDGDKAKEAINKMKIRLGELGSEIIERGAPILEKLMDGVSGLLEWFNKLPDGVQNVALAIGGLGIAGGPAMSAIGRVTEGIGGIVSKLGEGGGGMLAKLKDVIHSPAGMIALGVAGATAFYGIMDAVDKANTEAGKHRATVQGLFADVDSLAGTYESLAQKREESIDKANSEYDYYDNLAKELEGIVDANGKIKEGYESRVTFITGELSKAYGVEVEIVDGVIQKYGELKGSIEEASNARRAEALLQGQEEAYKNAQENLEKIKDTIDGLEKEREYALEQYTKATEKANRTRSTSDQAYAGQMLYNLNLIDGKINESKGVREGYYNTIATYEATTMALQQGNYKEAIKISNSLTDNVIKEGMTREEERDRELEQERTLLESLKKLYASNKSETVKSMIEASEARIKELENEKKTTAELGDDIVNEYKNVTGEAKKAGANTGQSFADGILSKRDAILRASKNVANAGIKGWQNTYQIASPSKVMKRMAEYAYAGWELGSEQQMPKLTSQSAEMAESINKSFSDSFSLARTAQFGSPARTMAQAESVSALRQALQGVKIVLDDEVAGHFVEKTVTNIVYG